MIIMLLQCLNLLKALCFIDVPCIQINTSCVAQIFFSLPNLQNIFQPFQRNGNDSGICACQEITQWFDTSLTDKVLNLVMGASRSCIRNCPSSLFLNVKLRSTKQRYQWRDDIGINHSLNLVLISCSDIRYGPTCFFLNALLIILGKKIQ
eukprot:TRINITY_DN3207_c0_g1_i2.p2 TRINITY_DN3207_c0_g1~~TRINITY_DN3207_c0_g1_i2.p2  ORF type:complete len:150 (+),score=13.90 TRINITY_DN3207_c0_g1_i2:1297-1746(+)